ncbi:EF-hand domain-containing protein [Sphingomonas sp. RS2018]
MILLFLAAQAVQPAATDAQATRRPDAYRPPQSTIVAEPVALLLTGFDRDGDARVTLAETRAGIAAITAGPEWQAGLGYLAFADWSERWLGDRNGVPTPFEIDRDGDNRVTATELAARVEAIFTRLDANRDGTLSRAEMLTVRSSPMNGNGRGRREGDRQDGGPPRR